MRLCESALRKIRDTLEFIGSRLASSLFSENAELTEFICMYMQREVAEGRATPGSAGGAALTRWLRRLAARAAWRAPKAGSTACSWLGVLAWRRPGAGLWAWARLGEWPSPPRCLRGDTEAVGARW